MKASIILALIGSILRCINAGFCILIGFVAISDVRRDYEIPQYLVLLTFTIILLVESIILARQMTTKKHRMLAFSPGRTSSVLAIVRGMLILIFVILAIAVNHRTPSGGAIVCAVVCSLLTGAFGFVGFSFFGNMRKGKRSKGLGAATGICLVLSAIMVIISAGLITRMRDRDWDSYITVMSFFVIPYVLMAIYFFVSPVLATPDQLPVNKDDDNDNYTQSSTPEPRRTQRVNYDTDDDGFITDVFNKE